MSNQMTLLGTSQVAPRRSGNFTIQTTREGQVIRGETGRVDYLLNDTARALWELCDGQTTVEEMITGICQLFDADRAAVTADVEAVLHEFTTSGLVTWPARPVGARA